MDIKERVKEIRITRDKHNFVSHFSTHKPDLDALIQLTLDLEEYPYKEYASWILVHLIKSKTVDLRYLYPSFVDLIFKTTNQTVLRNVINCLDLLKITDYRESELIDKLIGFIQNYENKVALHVYSISILAQFCEKYPELIPEIMEIIDLNNEGKSAAFRFARRDFIKKTSFN